MSADLSPENNRAELLESAATADAAMSELERHRLLSMQARRHALVFDGRTTVWREWGEGTPVVLLHGGYGSWTHWTRNIAALARHRRVLVPDTPGFGESDLPAEITISAVVASLWRDLDALAASGPIDLVGFSYGGVLAGEMAAVRPARIGKLVLVTAGGLLTPGDDPDLIRWRGLDEEAQREAHRINLQRLMFARPETADELAVTLQFANARAARLDSRKFRGSYDLVSLLAGRGQRVSGIWSDRDAARGGLPPELYEEGLRRIDPDAHFVVLRGIGHWLQYEAAEEFNATLDTMLHRGGDADVDRAAE